MPSKDVGVQVLLRSTAPEDRVYFVHSFRAMPEPGTEEWVLATAEYGDEYVAVVSKGNVHACQFHPEKSGPVGQAILENFLDLEGLDAPAALRAAGDGAPLLQPPSRSIPLFCPLLTLAPFLSLLPLFCSLLVLAVAARLTQATASGAGNGTNGPPNPLCHA